jgi:AraC family transcriptional regulator
VLEVHELVRGRLVRVADVTCRAARGGCGAEEYSAAPQVVVPRRGVFCVRRGRQEVVADALTAVLLEGEYRVSHPADGGDRCLAVTLAPELHEEAFGAARVLPVRQRLRVTLTADELEAEEGGLGLVAQLVDAAPLRSSPRVERVRELLAAAPTRRWTLSDIAGAVHVSPFHLARQFRAGTGETLARYLLGLRLALALDRLQEGEDDLARLAADLGFASHSHFTERFRHAFGRPPSKVRKNLTAHTARAT